MAVRRYLAVAFVLLATAAAVVAVSGARRPEPKQASPTPADAAYAEMMIAHHAQAVRMSKDLLARPGVPDRVRDIAGFIVTDQEREIGQLSEWLAAWHLATGADSEHGMLSAADLTRLGKAPTAEAVPLYLSLLARHPGWVNAHYNLGHALMTLGRCNEAIPEFRRTLELQPEFPAARLHLGTCLGAGAIRELPSRRISAIAR